ncbi:MAG: cell envelope integrity protein TolA [Hydrotalea sp.]|nr:cell envelope integrity protein TolA [Hydrotalea sp.]
MGVFLKKIIICFLSIALFFTSTPIVFAQSNQMVAADSITNLNINVATAAQPQVEGEVAHTLSLDEATCYIATLGGHKVSYVGFYNKCKPGTGLGVGKLSIVKEKPVFTLIFCIGYCGGLKTGVPVAAKEENINNLDNGTGENIKPGAVNILNKQQAAKNRQARQAELAKQRAEAAKQRAEADKIAREEKKAQQEEALKEKQATTLGEKKALREQAAKERQAREAELAKQRAEAAKQRAEADKIAREEKKAQQEEALKEKQATTLGEKKALREQAAKNRQARQAELAKQRAEADKARRAQEEAARKERQEKLAAEAQARQEKLAAEAQARRDAINKANSERVRKNLGQLENPRRNDDKNPNANTMSFVIKNVEPTTPPESPEQQQKDVESGLAALRRFIGGQIILKADVGYIYNFSQPDNFKTLGLGTSQFHTMGYGVSFGYTHQLGIGLSVDYLGFQNNITAIGVGENADYQYNYKTDYNIVTLTPNYRFKLDSDGHFGMRIGLGIGVNRPNIYWHKEPVQAGNGAGGGVRVASGATYEGPTPYSSIHTKCDDIFNPADDGFLRKKYDDSQGYGEAPPAWHNYFCKPGEKPPRDRDAEFARMLEEDRGAFEGGIRPGSFKYVSGTVAYGVWDKILSEDKNFTGAAVLNGATDFEHGPPTPVRYNVWDSLSPETQAGLTAAGGYREPLLTAIGPDATPVPKTLPQSTPIPSVLAPALPINNPGDIAKDIGLVIAPQVSVEYDYGMLHADMNIRYLHEFKKTKIYDDSNLTINNRQNVNYTSQSGSLAVVWV